MSSAISLVGGVPLGLRIFGFFFGFVPAAAASRLTSGVGAAGLAGVVVGGGGGGSVAGVGVDAERVEPAALGMSAVLVPPPQAESGRQAAAAATGMKVLSRITARNPNHFGSSLSQA